MNITFEQVIMLAQLIVSVLALHMTCLSLILGIVWKLFTILTDEKRNKKK